MQEGYYHVVTQTYTKKNLHFPILLLTASQPMPFSNLYGPTESQTAESVKDVRVKYTHLRWTNP